MSDPKVSVILPTFNRAHLISKSVNSVLRQSFSDFELFVVDDGSTDDTEAVVAAIPDPRLRYVQLPTNGGGSAARNVGIGLAQGDYLAFQDSDDAWAYDKLRRQVAAMESASPETGVVYTGFWLVRGARRTYIPFPRVKKRSGWIHAELLKENFVTTPSILVRKSCLMKCGGFDERLPRLQDWELVIRLSKDYKFLCVDEPLLTSYRTEDSISSNGPARVKALKMILDKHYDEFRNAGELSGHLYLLFELHFAAHDCASAVECLRRAYRANPGDLKHLALAIVLVMPSGRKVYNEVARVRDEKLTVLTARKGAGFINPELDGGS